MQPKDVPFTSQGGFPEFPGKWKVPYVSFGGDFYHYFSLASEKVL